MIKIISIKGSTEFISCPTCSSVHANYNTETKKMVCSMCGRKFKIRDPRIK